MPYYGEAEQKDDNERSNHYGRGRRIMPQLPMKLLSPKAVFVTNRDNIRGGEYVQVINEIKKHAISIPEVSEVKWNSCGKMMTAIGETVLCSGLDKGRCHERGVS